MTPDPAPDEVRCEALVSGHPGWRGIAAVNHRCPRRANQMRGQLQVCWQHAKAKMVEKAIKEDYVAYHFVGFRDDRYWNAVKVFGKPDFIHRGWDQRAQREIAPQDVIVFANGDEKQPVSKNGISTIARRCRMMTVFHEGKVFRAESNIIRHSYMVTDKLTGRYFYVRGEWADRFEEALFTAWRKFPTADGDFVYNWIWVNAGFHRLASGGYQ